MSRTNLDQLFSKITKPIRNFVFIFLGAGILGLIIALIAFFVVSQFANARRNMRLEVAKLDDSSHYMLDISQYLSPDWQTEQPVDEGQEDILGWSASIAGQTSIAVRNVNNPLSYVRLHVIAYVSDEQARDQYFKQEEWIFERDFGIPETQQLYTYESLDIPDEMTPKASEYHLGCKNTAVNTRCGGLFLYGNHIVYLDAFPRIDSVRYLSEEGIASVVAAIDRRMTTTV